MMRVAFFAVFLASTAFSSGENIGTATHSGSGTVKHDGDYIDFNISFHAWNNKDYSEPRTKVIENVAAFESWLKEQITASSNNNLSYNIDLINVWQDSEYYDYNGDVPLIAPIGIPAVRDYQGKYKYHAEQTITLRLDKNTNMVALDDGFIQKFFGDMQNVIAPLNSWEEPGCYTKITSVSKGVHEDTANQLRRAAKIKARNNAINDFSALLGDDYKGFWRLQSVTFNDNHFGYARPMALESFGNTSWGGQAAGPVLSTLKLEPISYSISGEFKFEYQVWDNYVLGQ